MKTLNQKLTNEVRQDMEAEANEFNLKALAVLCGVVVLCAFLNRIGIFIVDQQTMSVAVVLASVSFSAPIAVWIVHDWLPARERQSIFLWRGFKYLIILSSFVGITATAIVLTFHAVILLVVPGVFAAQYAYSDRFLKWDILMTAVLVTIAVYGGYFFGLPDRNYFKDYISNDALTFAERLAVCTPHTLLTLFEHFVVPRFLSIFVIDVAMTGIVRRNTNMTVRKVAKAERDASEKYGEKRGFELRRVVMDAISASDDRETDEQSADTEAVMATVEAAKKPVKIARLSVALMWVVAFIMAVLSNSWGYKLFAALTALCAMRLIHVSRNTQGHYHSISSAYMAGAGAWAIMELFELAIEFAQARGCVEAAGSLSNIAQYLSYLPDCMFVTGLILFSKYEYNQLHFRRMTLHAFTISYMAFMIVQKLIMGRMPTRGALEFDKLGITLYFFVIVFAVVMVITIFFQTKFRGHTLGTNCSAVLLVVFNFIELCRLHSIVTGRSPLTLLAESTGALGLVVYSWAQSDPALILRKPEPEPIRPGDHVQNKIIWGTSAAILLLGAVLYVIGFFDARDIYLILLSVLAYVIIYKSIQAGVYSSELIQRQLSENRRLEQVVNEKTAALEKVNEHLRYISGTDELTGLYNRRFGIEMVNQLTHGTSPFAFLLMDLNRFKQVNDVHGHEVGDQVLKETGARLAKLDDGATPIRLGGDEFLIIVLDKGGDLRERACRAAEEICAAMNRPIPTTAGDMTTTACIGIALWPEDTDKQDELYRMADKTMYEIKHRRAASAYNITPRKNLRDT